MAPKTLVIIPARSGSKGLLGKNVKCFHGAPLLAWSIAAGLEIADEADVIVSTDCADYANVARKYGAKVPVLRPEYLATDTATTFDAVAHMIDYMEAEEERDYDKVILLEPTSPLRPCGLLPDIMSAFRENEEINAVITVGDFWQEPSIQINTTSSDPYHNFRAARRQDIESVKFPFGLAYAVKKASFLKEKGFYISPTHFIDVEKKFCAEIDDIVDWNVAEALAEKVIDEGTCCRPRVNG